jgi:hypothetical protein
MLQNSNSPEAFPLLLPNSASLRDHIAMQPSDRHGVHLTCESLKDSENASEKNKMGCLAASETSLKDSRTQSVSDLTPQQRKGKECRSTLVTSIDEGGS